eukprot:540685_1
MIQLRYDEGSKDDKEYIINNGNVEPYRGFGHIAFNTDNVYTACEQLEKNGVTFKKKPNEGRMKGLAFAYDPNGYWVEIVKRDTSSNIKCQYNLSQTMIRIKNPEKSLKFYCDILGMRLLAERHFEKAKFSLYFLSSFCDEIRDLNEMSNDERWELVKKQYNPVLELTHNWGTEANDDFEYHNGSEQCELGQGFAQISFLVNNLKESVLRLKENNAEFKDLPKYLKHKQGLTGFTFLEDPDEYTIELLQRGESPINPYPDNYHFADDEEKEEMTLILKKSVSEHVYREKEKENNIVSVEGIDELNKLLKEYENKKEKKDRIFLLFCGSIIEGKSWCPDCVVAKPIIDDNLHELNTKSDLFVTVYVG